MLLSKIVNDLQLVSRNDSADDREITGGYCSDLLSDVLAHATAGDVWVTNQKHQNCIAVASLLELGAVVVAGGVDPDESTIQKAVAEGIPLFTTDATVFDVVGRLYQLGLRSKRRSTQ
ncbi:MAG: serine kinase [Armatimonadota bacterium]